MQWEASVVRRFRTYPLFDIHQKLDMHSDTSVWTRFSIAQQPREVAGSKPKYSSSFWISLLLECLGIEPTNVNSKESPQPDDKL